MITDLLDITRMEVGQFRLQRAPVNVAGLARTLVAEQELAHADRRYSLDAPAEPVIGEYDALRLQQALSNLLDNAYRYSFPATTITATVAREPDAITLSVADEGIGIPPDKLHEIFEPFKRLDEAENIKGFGLGLYITKGIAEAHGGALTVASGAERKHGAVFTLRLPV
jgi:signal transduction histidine kinase